MIVLLMMITIAGIIAHDSDSDYDCDCDKQ